MSEHYFAPMYGGLMLPLIRKQGSAQTLTFDPNHSQFDHHSDVSPGSNGSRISPFSDISPRTGIETSYFGYRLPSPTNLQHGSDQKKFHFKRGRSDASVDSTVDESPLLIPNPKLARSEDSSVRSNQEIRNKISSVVTVDANLEYEENELDHLPILRFGEDGRARLKAALSDLVRKDAHVKERVEAIGKIRLASMQQLMRMAKVAGLWSYAESLVREHDSFRNYRRSS